MKAFGKRGVIMKAIVNGRIILEDKILEGSIILFEEKIVDIISQNEFGKAYGNYISPGFIDLHIHGSNNSDVMDSTEEALVNISKTISKTGVTGFLPTTMTMDRENILKALENIRINKERMYDGAKILGVHLEGPFISKKYKGAQSSENIIAPEYYLIENYADIIKIITYAPEEDEDFKFTDKICSCHKDIVLSIGHTDATYDISMEAIKKGVKHITHLFNAMPGFHHRNPGVLGAAFNTDVSCELIADNIHVSPENYNIILKLKGKNKLVLVTDSMRASFLKNGKYNLGGQEVWVDGNSARLKDGTLAGSVLKLNNAVKNIYEKADIDLINSILLVTLNPAKVIGIDDKKGSIKKGKDSDFVIIDKNFEVLKTIVGGKVVYEK
jgi:N-acetylglucosamine-6-phosphate deacetylase